MDPSAAFGIGAERARAGAGRKRLATDDDRRRQALDAAEAMFLANGYHRTTMATIARSASMSKKTIYQVFGSKEDLMDAVLTRRLATLTRPLDAADDDRPPAQVLTALLLQFASFVLAPDEIAFVRLLIADAIPGDELTQLLSRKHFMIGRTTLAQWLARQAELGMLCGETPEAAAEMLVGMVLGDLHSRLLLRLESMPSETALEQRVARAVSLFLRACRR
jgi:AcrR family transcriptional regulator